MDKKFFEALQNWQQHGRRIVKIELGTVTSNKQISVWLYDFDVMAGGSVKTTEELAGIDLLAERRRNLEEQLASLPLAA